MLVGDTKYTSSLLRVRRNAAMLSSSTAEKQHETVLSLAGLKNQAN